MGSVPQCTMAADRAPRLVPVVMGLVIASGMVMAHAANTRWRAAALTIAAAAITLATRLNPMWMLLAGGGLGGLGLL